MKKALKQTLIIIVISAVLGIIVNFINKDGIALVMENTERYSREVDKTNEHDNDNNQNPDLSNLPEGQTNQTEIKEPVKISGDFAKQLFDRNAVFVDGRPRHEFEQNHIPNAVNIPYEEIRIKTPEEKEQMVKDINKNSLIVTYCSGEKCDISIDVAYEFFDLGYKNVNIYLGGLEEWSAKGYPTTK